MNQARTLPSVAWRLDNGDCHVLLWLRGLFFLVQLVLIFEIGNRYLEAEGRADPGFRNDRDISSKLLEDHLGDGQSETHASLVQRLRLLDGPKESEEPQ